MHTCEEGLTPEDFLFLCVLAHQGETAKVLAAVDRDRRLATRAGPGGNTLLLYACNGNLECPELVQGLLERGANVDARDNDDRNGLIWASYHGHVAVCTVLLDHGADPDSSTLDCSALIAAAIKSNLKLCLLLIYRSANLMLMVDGRTALDRYGEDEDLTLEDLEQHRATLKDAFAQGPHPHQVVGRATEYGIFEASPR